MTASPLGSAVLGSSRPVTGISTGAHREFLEVPATDQAIRADQSCRLP
jgi:hypothetical protein